MSENIFKIFIVDDAASMRMLLRSQLEGLGHEIFEFSNGDDCIQSAELHEPHLIILDIEMPGKSGIDTCRELRSQGFNNQILFFSSDDNWETRLLAYDVGGNDFVQKNAEQELLLVKVRLAEQAENRARTLSEQLQFTQKAAYTAISSLGETGIVLQFIQNTFHSNTLNQLANALITAIDQYGLNGIVCLSSAFGETYLNMQKPCTQLEISLLNRLSNMARIFESTDRLGINYPKARLLISGIQEEDPERVGRLRDHLALICEGADARISALEQEFEKDKQTRVILQSAREMAELISDMSMAQNANHARLVEVTDKFRSKLDHLFMNLGLTETQEESIHQLANQLHEEAADIFEQENEMAERLNQILSNQKKKLTSARQSVSSHPCKN
jgi:CheY-like chemotaxis protein